MTDGNNHSLQGDVPASRNLSSTAHFVRGQTSIVRDGSAAVVQSTAETQVQHLSNPAR